jgi:hypothetical protein
MLTRELEAKGDKRKKVSKELDKTKASKLKDNNKDKSTSLSLAKTVLFLSAIIVTS